MSIAVQQMFDRIAGRYDFLNHFLSLRRDIAWRKKACRRAGPADRVLDLCGGTGDFLMTYQKTWGKGKLGIIADFSMGMLKIAQVKSPSTPLLQVDAQRLPFDNQRFDLALCGYGMRNLDSNAQGLSEVARVLKPNGRFVVLEFFKPANPWTRFFYGVMAPLFIPILGALFSGRREAYEYLVMSVKRYLSVQEFADLASQNGFVCEEIHPLEGGISHLVVLRRSDVI